MASSVMIHQVVLFRNSHKRKILQRIAVDQQEIGIGLFDDDTNGMGIRVARPAQAQQLTVGGWGHRLHLIFNIQPLVREAPQHVFMVHHATRRYIVQSFLHGFTISFSRSIYWVIASLMTHARNL